MYSLYNSCLRSLCSTIMGEICLSNNKRIETIGLYCARSVRRRISKINKRSKDARIFDLETGFIICNDPQSSEAAYNRHRFLCWLSPRLMQTTVLTEQKPVSTPLSLRMLTTSLADRVSSLINTRHVLSPNKFDQQVDEQSISMNIVINCFQRDFYEPMNSTMATPDPLAALRNSVYWKSSPG
jgi:hypothetical protein